MKQRNTVFAFLILGVLMLVSTQADAQCAMCTKAAADGIKDGMTTTVGLNKAIFYLLLMPYALIGTIGLMWYYNKRKLDREELA